METDHRVLLWDFDEHRLFRNTVPPMVAVEYRRLSSKDSKGIVQYLEATGNHLKNNRVCQLREKLAETRKDDFVVADHELLFQKCEKLDRYIKEAYDVGEKACPYRHLECTHDHSRELRN